MKINEIITEAGIARNIAGAAAGLTKMFSPSLGKDMQQALSQSDRLQKQRSAPVQQPIRAATPTPAAPAATAQRYVAKPLSAFRGILPTKVEVVNRNPLVIRYQNNDYHYDYKDGNWKNTAGKIPPEITQDLLAQWGVAIDKFDPLPEKTPTAAPEEQPAVLKSNRPIATVNTVIGKATKSADGKWYVIGRQVTRPEDIAKLDQEARETGQIK